MLPTKTPGDRECLFVGGPWDGRIERIPEGNVGRPWRVAVPAASLCVSPETGGGPEALLIQAEVYVPLRWIAMRPEWANWLGADWIPQFACDANCVFDEWIYYAPEAHATLGKVEGIW